MRMVLWTNTNQNSTCIADEENTISNLAKPQNLTCICILFVCKWLALFPSSHGAQTCHVLLTMNPNKSNPIFFILKRWFGELLWSAQYTTYCTSEGTFNLQYNENTILGKSWPNLIQLLVESAMGEKQRPGTTVPNCLPFRKKMTANGKDCLMMLHMFMGSIPLFLRGLFQNYLVHLNNHVRDTKPMRFQLHFWKLLWKQIACKTSGKCFSWPGFKLSSVGALSNFCTQTPTVWCWGIRISSHCHGLLKSGCHFQKHKRVSSWT